MGLKEENNNIIPNDNIIQDGRKTKRNKKQRNQSNTKKKFMAGKGRK